MGDILDGHVPPDDADLEEEKKHVESLREEELNKIKAEVLLMNRADPLLKEDLLVIAEIRVRRGELEARNTFRKGARFLEDF